MPLDAEHFPLDRFEPISEIGRGASGFVYLCRDLTLGKEVAVKCLRFITAEQLISFQREAKATSQLQHKGVVAVIDFGTTAGGAPYMVMEYAQGMNLESWIQLNGPLSPALAVRLFAQTADALSYAHSKKILHRDLKSSNLLIVEVNKSIPEVRLIDFGVALVKHASQEPTIVQGRTLVGTPAYMPPDQAFGLPYDERSEIYALGCVMFEALTGRPPYVGATALETISMHAHHPIPALASVRDDVEFSESLERTVGKCLAKNADERFADMDELRDALVEDAETLDDTTEPADAIVMSRPPMVPLQLLLFSMAILIGFAVPLYMVLLWQAPVERSATTDDETEDLSMLRALDAHKKKSSDDMEESYADRGLFMGDPEEVEKTYVKIEMKKRKLGLRQLAFCNEISTAAEMLAEMDKHKDADHLIIKRSNVTADMVDLVAGSQISEVVFSYDRIDDAAQKRIVKLRKLDRIEIQDSSMRSLEGLELPALRSLVLINVGLSGGELKYLKGAPKLEDLCLDGSGPFTSEELANALSALPRLKFLNLNNTGLTNELLGVVARSAPALKKLHVSGNELINPSGLKVFRGRENLTVRAARCPFIQEAQAAQLGRILKIQIDAQSEPPAL